MIPQNMRWGLVVLGLLAAWMASGLLWPSKQTSTPTLPALPTLPVVWVAPEAFQRTVTLSGFTEADSQATLAAQTAGRVEKVAVNRGDMVSKGDVLIHIALADRTVRLQAAKAEVARTRKLQHAARQLFEEGYMAATVLAEREANHQAALERLAAAQLDMDYAGIQAPFEGVVEDVMVKEGDTVAIGTPVLKLVSQDNVLVVGFVGQTEHGMVQAGALATATLANGTAVPAVVRFVATDADVATRTYRVEAVLDTTTSPVPTGMSANVVVSGPSVSATRLQHRWLMLNDQGQIGVMTAIVTSPTLARFVPLTVLNDTPDGIWVEGITTPTHIIALGQTTVQDGALIQTSPTTTHKDTP